MSNKTGDVTWSEENDEDLDDSVEDTQSNNYANNIVAGAPARTRHLPEPPVSTVKSESHVPVHDLRTMINRLSTSNTIINNFNNLGSRTSTDTTSHAAYSEWKSEPDWKTRFDTRIARHTDIDRRSDLRNDIEASKLAPTGSGDLESPETLAAGTSGSVKIPSSRPVASGSIILHRQTFGLGRDCPAKAGYLSTTEPVQESLKRQGVQST
ncbi:hypothetical protein BGX24_011051 [Mortierella sp. AD032]|nr:hypothetical protein BGX24_011051 [Mortierella sp. AD032]